MLNTNEQWSDKQSHITELKIWKKCDPKMKNESAQNCKIFNITVLLQCCKCRIGKRQKANSNAQYFIIPTIFLSPGWALYIILRSIDVVRFRASSSAINKVTSAIWRQYVFLLRYRLKHVSEYYLSHRSPNFFLNGHTRYCGLVRWPQQKK